GGRGGWGGGGGGGGAGGGGGWGRGAGCRRRRGPRGWTWQAPPGRRAAPTLPPELGPAPGLVPAAKPCSLSSSYRGTGDSSSLKDMDGSPAVSPCRGAGRPPR